MCRNIRNLYNFDPPVTDDEIRDASLQFVRKISGFNKPSKTNEEAFYTAIDEITEAAKKLMESLVTSAKPRNREIEYQRAKLRNEKRFGTKEKTSGWAITNQNE